MEVNLSKLECPPQGQVFLELFNLLPLPITLLMCICIFLYNHGLSNWMHEILQARELGAESAGYWALIPTLIGILGALFLPRRALPNLRFWILAGLFIITGTSAILLKSYSEPLILMGLALKGITQGSMMTILLLILIEITQVGFHYAGSGGGMFFAGPEIGGVLVGPLSLGLLSDYDEGFQSGFTM